jgi:hypothetical protein
VIALLSALVSLLVAAPSQADPKDTIKNHKYEIRAVPYNDGGHGDPFVPLVPLKQEERHDLRRVRIISLRLSSVIVGRSKVAVFNELHGPVYSYILVNGVLLGPDHKPVPGIAGVIEPTRLPGEYHVTLRQGAEKVDYSIRNLELINRKLAKGAHEAHAGSGATTGTGGGS